MIFVGDIHGHFDLYADLVGKNFPDQPSIQVGDYGIGFNSNKYYLGCYGEESVPHKFIRGNHDNPSACALSPNWIPDGHTYHGVFCVGGAKSIDAHLRTEGVDWWRDEELSYAQCQDILKKYEELKPDIVCSHDGPERIINSMFRNVIPDPSITRQLLDAMLDIHVPKLHIFGHWHESRTMKYNGCEFRCLNVFEFLEI